MEINEEKIKELGYLLSRVIEDVVGKNNNFVLALYANNDPKRSLILSNDYGSKSNIVKVLKRASEILEKNEIKPIITTTSETIGNA